jgi:outer membrane protein assembly factor BamB
MVSWYFDEVGAFITEERVNGLTASNEQLKDGAIHNGYLHLCGSSTNSGGTDLKVVCLDANNNYLWSDTYNKNGLTEEGTVITTSNHAFVVAGYVTDPNVGENLLARKYSVNGSLLWHVEFDHEEENDRVLDVLEDAEGNYLLLAQVTRTGQNDVYLYALNGNTGALLWVEAIANDVNKNEKAQSIESNMDGQVYITYTIKWDCCNRIL